MNIHKNLTRVNNTRFSLDPFPRSQAITYVALLILESLVIIIGNAIVITVLTTTRQFRQRKSHWLLVNLAATDLLVGAVSGPTLTYTTANKSDLLSDKPPEWITLTLTTIGLFFSYASVYNLAVLSLERMYATLWPLKHRVLRAIHYHVMIGLSWSLPIFVTSIDIVTYLALVSRVDFNNVLLVVAFSLLLTIIGSYVSIWIKLKFFRHPQHHVTTAQDRKLTISLFLVTVTSITTWLSSAVLITVTGFIPKNMTTPRITVYTSNSSLLLLFANSLMNPIFYTLRMPQFRRAALRLVHRCTTVPAIQMRSRAADINRQGCAVNSEPNLTFDTRL